MAKIKQQPLSLMNQMISLRSNYGEIIDSCFIRKNNLTCVMRLQPSPESAVYTIKIIYKPTDIRPNVWLLSPELQKSNGKYPHHIYGWDSAGHPRLCVYYPYYKEWNTHMLLATSFVPWILTWLHAYEYWRITGEWYYSEAPAGNKKNP